MMPTTLMSELVNGHITPPVTLILDVRVQANGNSSLTAIMKQGSGLVITHHLWRSGSRSHSAGQSARRSAPAAGVHRDDPVVESGKTPFVLGDQLWLKRSRTVARHGDAQRALVGQHRLAAAAVAVVATFALGVRQVQAQLGAQGPLDHGLLELLEHSLHTGRIHRAWDKLFEEILRDINGRRGDRRLLLAWHTCSLAASWYAPHTKFLTPSVDRGHASRCRSTVHTTDC